MPLRLVVPIALFILVAFGGCGDSSSDEQSTTAPTAPVGASASSCESEAVDARGLRVTGVACDKARAAMLAWQRARSCAPPAGASRGSCSIRSYRCVATATARGTAVSCSRPGESIAFQATRP